MIQRQAQKKTKKINSSLMLVMMLMLTSFVLGYQLATDNYALPLLGAEYSLLPSKKTGKLDLGEFWKVYDLLDEKYLRMSTISDEALVEGAIEGLVNALEDPYTYYLDEVDTTDFQDGLDGAYQGIGVQLGYGNDSELIVVAPLSGSPAESAGMKSQDVIVGVDNTPVDGLNLSEVVDLIRGEAGTAVTMNIVRKGKNTEERLDIAVVRDDINAPNILFSAEEGNIAYVNILRFGTGIEKDWKNLVRDENLKAYNGIVFDLRGNPGGFLNGAVEIASSFTHPGVMVSEQFANGTKKDFLNDDEGELVDMPVVVLINGSSASASEILAGILKLEVNAVLVGEQSFGKNTVQEAHTLGEGKTVHITVANWVLPNGEIIPDEGIEPEVIVASSEDGDVQKDTALMVLQERFLK